MLTRCIMICRPKKSISGSAELTTFAPLISGEPGELYNVIFFQLFPSEPMVIV